MNRPLCVVALLASACATTHRAAGPLLPVPGASVQVTEAMERAWIAEDGRARLVDLGGDAHSGTTLTIHGMNAAPADVAALSSAALERGERVFTLAYDDNYRRLGATADDFARAIADLHHSVPRGTRVQIDAHSMGARVVVVALDRLRRAGRLPDRPLSLHLIAPLLSGVRAANSAWLMTLMFPFGLSRLIMNAEPSRDLGPDSDFQRELESATFPSRVRVRISLAARDRFPLREETVLRLAARWRASVRVMPGTTHRSVLAAVSQPHGVVSAHLRW